MTVLRYVSFLYECTSLYLPRQSTVNNYLRIDLEFLFFFLPLFSTYAVGVVGTLTTTPRRSFRRCDQSKYKETFSEQILAGVRIYGSSPRQSPPYRDIHVRGKAMQDHEELNCLLENLIHRPMHCISIGGRRGGIYVYIVRPSPPCVPLRSL